MRTTVTLDPDTRLLVERLMRERDLSFKDAVNTAIRAGLAPAATDEPITIPRDLGAAKVDLTKALALAGQMEDEEIIRKMAIGR
ncbi:MAG: antitoxin [Solirubrobacteraceae bacterium]